MIRVCWIYIVVRAFIHGGCGGGTDGGVGVAPDLSRDLEGSLVVSALEHVLLPFRHLARHRAVLFLQAPELLNQLALVEIQLQLALDLVVEHRRVVVVVRRVGGPALRCVLEEPLQQLDLVLVGPQPLKELSRFVPTSKRLLLLHPNSVIDPLPLQIGAERAVGDAGNRDGDRAWIRFGGGGRRRWMQRGVGERIGGEIGGGCGSVVIDFVFFVFNHIGWRVQGVVVIVIVLEIFLFFVVDDVITGESHGRRRSVG